MKEIGYYLFACVYWICRIFPMNKKKVFCIMTHDSSEDSNVGTMVKEFKSRGDYQFVFIKKDDKAILSKNKVLSSMFSFFFVKPFHLATSHYVFLDNIFLPCGFIRFRKQVKVVQLWHGTGTIKKFGQSVNVGRLAQLEQRANDTITHLIVNSKKIGTIYKEAFGVEEDKIYSLGLPRTDILFHKEELKRKEEGFYKEYPGLKGKKLILYAPTFRDNEINEPTLHMNIEYLLNNLSEDYFIGVKLHPHVARNFSLAKFNSKELKNRIYDFSRYSDMNELYMASYLLITDYSSILYEFCVLEKPMIFYAYDYEEFSCNGRGFYEDYVTMVPGPIARTEEELARIIAEDTYDYEKIRKFKEDAYEYTDGNAAKRIASVVLK